MTGIEASAFAIFYVFALLCFITGGANPIVVWRISAWLLRLHWLCCKKHITHTQTTVYVLLDRFQRSNLI